MKSKEHARKKSRLLRSAARKPVGAKAKKDMMDMDVMFTSVGFS